MKNKKKPTINKKVSRKEPNQNDLPKSTKKIDLAGIVKTSEYMNFLVFCALPRAMREKVLGTKDQQAFAEKFGLHEGTLSEWKQKPGFWDEAFAIRRDFFRERTADALLAMETKAIRTGDAAEVNSLLKYTGELKADTDPTAIPEAVANAVAKIFEVLK